MKKAILLVLMFFVFILTANASSPAGFIYDGPSEAKQGATITYDLRVRDGNYFFVYSQDDEDNFWSHEIEYDKHVLKFISFTTDFPEISMSNNETEEILTLKIEKEALGPYTEGQVIGKITFKVLEDSPLGEIKLYQPTGIDLGPNDIEMYKVVNILQKEDVKNVIEENDNDVKESNNILYILIGALSLSNILLVVTTIILISKNKNK